MPRPKGLPKTGGRKAGVPNYSSAAKIRKTLKLARFEANVKRVLEEYSVIAGLDIRDAFDADGNLKPIKDFPENLARSVAGIEFEEVFSGTGKNRVHVGRIHKIKLANKLGALDSIAKHLGMFVERMEHSGKDGGSIQLVVMPAGSQETPDAK